MSSQSRLMYESAQALATELGDQRAMVQALLGTRWFSDFWPELRARWRSNAEEALAISRQIGDDDLVLECELVTWNSGSRREAEQRSEHLIRQLKDRRDLLRLNLHYFSLMWANLEWAEFDRAVETCDLGIRLAQEIGVPPVQYPTLKALALLHLGRYGEAWESLQREVADADHPFGQAMQALGIASYYLELESYGRAAEGFRDLVGRAKKLRRAWMTHWGTVGLARSLLRVPGADPAALTEVGEQLRVLGDRVPRELTAEILLADGKTPAALAEVSAAVVEARAEDRIADLLDGLELKARVLLELGRPQEALPLVEEACRTAEERHAPPKVWRLLALKGRALSAVESSRGALEALSLAAATVTRVGDSITDSERKREFFASPSVAAVLARKE